MDSPAKQRILSQFEDLKQVFPESTISADGRTILVPDVELPARYSTRQATIVVKYDPQFLLPSVYVPHNLNTDTGLVPHVPDSKLTLQVNGASRTFVKLCWQNPPHGPKLRELVASVIMFLEGA